MPSPGCWPTRPDVVDQALLLALVFGDPKAALGPAGSRRGSRDTARYDGVGPCRPWSSGRVPGSLPICTALLDDPTLRGPVIRALAAYNDPATPGILLNRYATLSPSPSATTRSPRWPLAPGLGVGAAGGHRTRADPPPRREHHHRPADPGLRRSDGSTAARSRLGQAPADVARQGRPDRQVQGDPRLRLRPPADPDRGRAVFDRTCLSCHKLFDAGGDVGPDLTGSDRANPDYILENVLDPSASRGQGLHAHHRRDHRRPPGRRHHPRADAHRPGRPDRHRADHPAPRGRRGIKTSTTSMMPEGQLEPLSTPRRSATCSPTWLRPRSAAAGGLKDEPRADSRLR